MLRSEYIKAGADHIMPSKQPITTTVDVIASDPADGGQVRIKMRRLAIQLFIILGYYFFVLFLFLFSHNITFFYVKPVECSTHEYVYV